MKDKINTITSFVSTFFTTIVVSIAAILVVCQAMDIQLFSVESNSMAPLYPVDSLVFVKETPPENIQENDVISFVFNEDGMIVTHRVVAINEEKQTFKTKGDNNDVEDPFPVLFGNVIGKVMFGIPKAGAVVRVFAAEENRKYIIAAILVLLVINCFTGRKKKPKDNNAC